jgi:hypothetical protein
MFMAPSRASQSVEELRAGPAAMAAANRRAIEESGAPSLSERQSALLEIRSDMPAVGAA